MKKKRNRIFLVLVLRSIHFQNTTQNVRLKKRDLFYKNHSTVIQEPQEYLKQMPTGRGTLAPHFGPGLVLETIL